MGNNPLDVVAEFDAMRRGLGAAPSSLQSYSPPQPSPQRPTTPSVSGAPAAGGGPAPVPATGLVDFGGKKLDGSVLSYANEISRRFPGLRFTSGYRDPNHNSRVNGVPTSWHLKGRAMDWAGSAREMADAAAWARANGAREVLIHNAGSGQHLHTAW